MRYLFTLFAASALFSCNKDKRYICRCSDKDDNRVHYNSLHAASFTEGEAMCNITEDSVQKTNLFSEPYCTLGGGER
jgi:hypothetical protein